MDSNGLVTLLAKQRRTGPTTPAALVVLGGAASGDLGWTTRTAAAILVITAACRLLRGEIIPLLRALLTFREQGHRKGHNERGSVHPRR